MVCPPFQHLELWNGVDCRRETAPNSCQGCFCLGGHSSLSPCLESLWTYCPEELFGEAGKWCSGCHYLYQYFDKSLCSHWDHSTWSVWRTLDFLLGRVRGVQVQSFPGMSWLHNSLCSCGRQHSLLFTVVTIYTNYCQPGKPPKLWAQSFYWGFIMLA